MVLWDMRARDQAFYYSACTTGPCSTFPAYIEFSMGAQTDKRYCVLGIFRPKALHNLYAFVLAGAPDANTKCGSEKIFVHSGAGHPVVALWQHRWMCFCVYANYYKRIGVRISLRFVMRTKR